MGSIGNVRHFVARHRKLIFGIMLGITALIYIATIIPKINTEALGFDDGWILQAPQNLSDKGIYASNGSLFEGTDKLFDVYLSTGPAVTVPIAAVFKIFGAGVFQARIVMAIFFLSAIILAGIYVYSQTKSLYAIFGPMIILLLTSPPIDFHLYILGEIPAIAFTLGSLFAWSKNKYILAGVFAGLSFSSKTIMFFMIIAGFLVLGLRLIRHWRKIQKPLLQLGSWTLGVVIPVIIWETFKFIQLGGTFAAYKQNWREFLDFFKVSGSGLSENGTLLSIGDKLNMLSATVNAPTFLVIMAGVVITGLLFLQRKQLLPLAKKHAYALCFIAIYAGWWVTMSNGGFVRYVVPLMGVGLVAFLVFIFQSSKLTSQLSKGWRLTYHGLALVLILIGIWSLFNVYKPTPVSIYPYSLQDQEKVASIVKASRPPNLTHFGWWQNPEISFLAKLHSEREALHQSGEIEQALLSPDMLRIAPEDHAKIKGQCIEIYYEDAFGYTYCLRINQ